MYSDLKNKKIFILGGSGLIGSEIIINLYKLKCKIVNLDLNKNTSISHMCSFQKFNCEDKNIQKNYFKVTKKFGLPDAFINCSYPKTKDWIKNSFKNIKLSSLEKNINSNIVNSAILIKEVAELNLKSKKSCSIVLLSSIYGLVGQDPSIYAGTDLSENVSYSIIKGAIVNLTRQMSAYYSNKKIRINNVCAGGVFDERKSKNKKYKKLVLNYSKRSPIKRMAKPKEIALPVIFLASANSSYVTGASLVVDGGWTSI